MSDTSEVDERSHKIRFYNNRNTELIVGIEPLGLYYNVPPKLDIEVIFYLWTKPDDDNVYHDIHVDEDGSITLEIMSADVTVYLDHKKEYP